MKDNVYAPEETLHRLEVAGVGDMEFNRVTDLRKIGFAASQQVIHHDNPLYVFSGQQTSHQRRSDEPGPARD